MTREPVCLRCGSAELIPAHLEQRTAFCIDQDARHGVLHVGMKASLCRECGHVEFWVADPSQIAAPRHTAAARTIQEEDF